MPREAIHPKTTASKRFRRVYRKAERGEKARVLDGGFGFVRSPLRTAR